MNKINTKINSIILILLAIISFGYIPIVSADVQSDKALDQLNDIVQQVDPDYVPFIPPEPIPQCFLDDAMTIIVDCKTGRQIIPTSDGASTNNKKDTTKENPKIKKFPESPEDNMSFGIPKNTSKETPQEFSERMNQYVNKTNAKNQKDAEELQRQYIETTERMNREYNSTIQAKVYNIIQSFNGWINKWRSYIPYTYEKIETRTTDTGE